MKTVYTTLPFYDSTDKQDYERTGQLRPIITPRHQLPPFQFQVTSGVATAAKVELIDCYDVATDITTYFVALPALKALTDNDDYIQYKGAALKTLLPLGSYYLKMTDDDDNVYYSEWISVEDVYPSQITSFPSETYDTFTLSGTTITSAINLAGSAFAWGEQFSVREGENITVIVYLTLSSGQAPYVSLDDLGGLGTVSNAEQLSAGINEITLISTATVGAARVKIYNNAASNFATNEIIAIRQYSDDYIKLTFSNTKDLPTPDNEPSILYQDSFEDMIWFDTKLNTPEHETISEGTEKNGDFIAEKIVSVYHYKIIDYIGRNLYRSLHRLPLHDDVTIIDTVGNEYDVDHSITVDPVEWNYYDMGKLVIRFNDGASVWEGNASNLT